MFVKIPQCNHLAACIVLTFNPSIMENNSHYLFHANQEELQCVTEEQQPYTVECPDDSLIHEDQLYTEEYLNDSFVHEEQSDQQPFPGERITDSIPLYAGTSIAVN